MSDVNVVIGAGSIGQAIARRVSVGKHVVLADVREQNAAAAAKALSDFRRTSGLLAFKGGWMNGGALSPDQVDAIARLPSREVLYGRLVGMVASPLTGLAAALGGLIGGLARQLQQMAEQGLVGGDGAAAPTAGASEAEAATPEAAEASDAPSPEAAGATASAPEPGGSPEAAAGDTDAGPAGTPDDAGPHPDRDSQPETQED